ncbi:MAG: hypothetical protein NDJ90_00300 [Oligoflexia bacterium]|nr:hypothetical protein [Oligoflexia bacterium]
MAKKISKPAAKHAPKSAAKKGSKLTSIKEALFGKKKPESKTKAVKPAKPAAAKVPTVKSAKVAATKNGTKPAKNGHVAAQTKAGKQVVPAPAPAGKKGGAKAAPAPQPTKAATKPPLKGAAAKPVAPVAKPAVPATALKGKAAKEARALAKAPAVDPESVCREVACEGLATSGGYCRLHYIKNWKKIKRKEVILKEGKLNQYIEELVAKYPDKYLEAIRQDLASDKDFAKVIYDLDLDESVDDFESEGENVDSLIDSIKRDFDDEGEAGF